MLNPDGVVVGNYRCSLAGLDLNREYREPGGPTPTIRAFKEMAKAFMGEREVRAQRGGGPAGQVLVVQEGLLCDGFIRLARHGRGGRGWQAHA